MSVNEMSGFGCGVGTGLALFPAAATLLIASSRIILVNIIANTILFVLTGGQFWIEVYGISWILPVPLLWKISMISAAVGGTIIVGSLAVALINEIYLRVVKA